MAYEQMYFDGFESPVLDLPSTDNMLLFQEEMAKRFSYKPLPMEYSKKCREIYRDTLPLWIDANGSDIPLMTLSDTVICNRYERVVIGDYGAFIEINPQDMRTDALCVAKGQEYRFTDRYKNTVKYFWLTAKDDSNIKIYQQVRSVTYADYKPDMFYVSPFEVKITKQG